VLRGGNGFPLSERAGFGRHSQLRPRRAPALAASARGVQSLGVPFGTGAAGRFAGGEGFGWRGRCALADEIDCGVFELSKCASTKINEILWNHEKIKVGGVTSDPNPKFSVWASNGSPFIV